MNTDVLQTLAEIAATFAGFGALASLIGGNLRGGAQVAGIVETSLVALGTAVLPIVLLDAGWAVDVALRTAAAAFTLVWTAAWLHAALVTREIFANDPDARPDLPFVVVVFTANASGTLLGAALAAGVGAGAESTLYLALTVCPLVTASALLWSVVRLVAAVPRPPWD